eukprot:TRINITY_DN19934_c0_g1_i1.p1 TRINITY_DN19934_c0_g1~~TRINITY_DN19934_c0_g1_i1.p1  ORF type:complete len:237 (-),score=24.70 TRINITY_DN19934_c0_g1_i1:369-1079(-)
MKHSSTTLLFGTVAALALFGSAAAGGLRQSEYSNVRVASAAAASESDPAPWFCHGLNCPLYTSKCNTSDYEVRSYQLYKWSAARDDGIPGITKAMSHGFQKLFSYISGSNSAKKSIPMTAPVLQTISQDSTIGNVTHFMMPYDYQDQPLSSMPQPTDPDCFLTSTPAMDVAVVSYGGYSSDSDVLQNAARLRSALLAKGANADFSHFFAAGYDSPFRFFNRHNEIWFPLSDSDSAC